MFLLICPMFMFMLCTQVAINSSAASYSELLRSWRIAESSVKHFRSNPSFSCLSLWETGIIVSLRIRCSLKTYFNFEVFVSQFISQPLDLSLWLSSVNLCNAASPKKSIILALRFDEKVVRLPVIRRLKRYSWLRMQMSLCLFPFDRGHNRRHWLI